MLAILLFFPLARSQSIQITVKSYNDQISATVFTSQSLTKAELSSEVQSFCDSIGGTVDCPSLLYNETLVRRSRAGIWTHPQLVRHHFTSDLIAAECQLWSYRGYSTESECNSVADIAIRSVKVAAAFPMADQLVTRITNNELVQVNADWYDGIEGNTFNYYQKVAFLQTLADDQRVERITEIGFNAGHSTLNWLLANPVASVLAFDVTRRLYASAAINAIGSMFPGRVVNLVTGDSTVSVPNYVRLINGHPHVNSIDSSSGGPKFNLIFIDGGHTYDIALADIMNMRALANRSYHILAIDDGSDADLRAAWEYAEHTLRIVKTHKIERMLFDECVQVVGIPSGLLAGSFEALPCAGTPEVSTVDEMIIGEYIWGELQ